jgi:CelD/BcsL family acetyltransferase involved in cellulose biosynthesis
VGGSGEGFRRDGGRVVRFLAAPHSRGSSLLLSPNQKKQPASNSAALLDSTTDSTLEDAADAAFASGGDAKALAAEWAQASAAEAAEQYLRPYGRPHR